MERTMKEKGKTNLERCNGKDNDIAGQEKRRIRQTRKGAELFGNGDDRARQEKRRVRQNRKGEGL
jgi:hypothetical protein